MLTAELDSFSLVHAKHVFFLLKGALPTIDDADAQLLRLPRLRWPSFGRRGKAEQKPGPHDPSAAGSQTAMYQLPPGGMPPMVPPNMPGPHLAGAPSMYPSAGPYPYSGYGRP